MKNPLNKRFPRELKQDIGKYIIIFLFITIMVGFVSGFLIATDSVLTAYYEGFEKYNIEDGNFELYYKADNTLVKTLREENIIIYENFYKERETDNIDSNLRIFKNREEVNKASLMEGKLPNKENEIAIDRMYANNNKINVGDILSVDGKKFIVSGFVALSDYSSLYENPSDMMFEAVTFGVAVVTEQAFDNLGDKNLHYSYSWKYDKAPVDDIEAKEMSENLVEVLSENAIVTNFIPQFSNPAIQFVGEDLGKDKPIMMAFLCIVVGIIAFIFAITTSNTITKESTVIGTLRASGYTKGELVRHYLAMPMFVTILSALIGNILGYTIFKDATVDMVYASWSLPTYTTIWNSEAFIITTVIPVLLMLVINLAILVYKMNLSPLKFIRRDLSRKKKKKALHLNGKIGFIKRFRIRVILQNIPNYVTIIFGIFFANIILLLGVAMPGLLEKYEDDITSNMICDYQYVLKTPVETNTIGAEKYCAGGLETIEGRLKSESVSLFGIDPNSKYIDLDLNSDDVYISSAFSEKFKIYEGDTVTLKEQYGNKEYSFKVKGVYYYPAGIALFMNCSFFNETFGNEIEYFNGYFSEREIKDIDELYIGTKITVDDLTKTSRQMEVSMGDMMDMLLVFGIAMFMMIIFLLSKIIIEKNAQSISMAKILGYTNKEISNLYIKSTSIVVITAFLITLPITNAIMGEVCTIMLAEFPGYISYYVPFMEFVKIAVLGIVAYSVVAFMQFKKVKKINLNLALKNIE